MEKGNKIITFSLILFIISLYLVFAENNALNVVDYKIDYEAFNTNNIATVSIATKASKKNTDSYSSEEMEKTSFSIANKEPVIEKTTAVPKVVWRLPVEQGTITTLPNYYHVALDITSARGVYETIYPVADGVISGIYYDSAGAKIITIYHNINGQNYTSQYVHLSSFAPDTYVGKSVTTNDAIGQMGATGIATGVHLHLSVTDCAMFNPNDTNCSSLDGFYNYLRLRYTQGFQGLNNIIDVPWSWTSR